MEINTNKQDLLEIYQASDVNGKLKMEEKFGKDFFALPPPKPWEKIKTIEDACAVEGITLSSITSDNDTADEAAYKKLKVITRAINRLANDGKEFIPEWKDNSGYKYWPWFWMNKSGVGFSFCDSYCGRTAAYFGSRLVFLSRELSDYAGRHFVEIYKAYMVIPQ